MLKTLKKNNIGSRVMYPPLNEQKCYNVRGNHPVSKRIGSNGLWLPSEAQLEDHQIDRICSVIIEFYKTFSIENQNHHYNLIFQQILESYLLYYR